MTMAEYIERSYIRKMAMFEMAYTMETETDAAVVLRMIDDAPAADVAPVVRCKDCKWFADNNDGDWVGCWLFQTIQIIPEDAPKPDDFCSYGERKEGAEC